MKSPSYMHPHHVLVEAMRQDQEAVASYERALAEFDAANPEAASELPVLEPLSGHESANELRPHWLDEVVGQERLKPLLRRLVDSARVSGRPLDHMLFVGSAGTGKTTLATVVAHEVGTRIFSLKAPLDMTILAALQQQAQDRDVIYVDEIHMQVSGDRRGLTQACDAESFYLLLEDGVLATPTGPVAFPKVTWIGATTDVGLLPQPLSDRFTIQPRLSPYTESEMAVIARRNMAAVGVESAAEVAELFAHAARATPRQVNNYVKAARSLAAGGTITREIARETVVDLAGTTLDGLTSSMQIVLRYMLEHGSQRIRDGVLEYSASAGALATAAGHGRDTKAINLLVEPYLLQRGYLEVRPGQGRVLTPAGVERARQLIGG